MQTFELEWLIGVGLSALVIGLLVGLAMGRTVFRGKKSLDTEAELAAAQDAMKEYRAEVYDQFAETARKFDTLNDSYNDLHRHLASSANVLLGDGISTPLLRGPAETNAAEAAQADDAQDASATVDDSIEGQAEPIDPAVTASEGTEPQQQTGSTDSDPTEATSTATKVTEDPNPATKP